jgi:hypothetical protein
VSFTVSVIGLLTSTPSGTRTALVVGPRSEEQPLLSGGSHSLVLTLIRSEPWAVTLVGRFGQLELHHVTMSRVRRSRQAAAGPVGDADDALDGTPRLVDNTAEGRPPSEHAAIARIVVPRAARPTARLRRRACPVDQTIRSWLHFTRQRRTRDRTVTEPCHGEVTARSGSRAGLVTR